MEIRKSVQTVGCRATVKLWWDRVNKDKTAPTSEINTLFTTRFPVKLFRWGKRIHRVSVRRCVCGLSLRHGALHRLVHHERNGRVGRCFQHARDCTSEPSDWPMRLSQRFVDVHHAVEDSTGLKWRLHLHDFL